jgi:hypothetical protein
MYAYMCACIHAAARQLAVRNIGAVTLSKHMRVHVGMRALVHVRMCANMHVYACIYKTDSQLKSHRQVQEEGRVPSAVQIDRY